MVQVLVAVPAHRGIAAHDDVGPVTADHAGEIAAQSKRRLDHTVEVAEKGEVRHAQDARGLPALALADRHEPVARRRVLVRAGASAGDQAEHHVPAFTRPRRDAPRDDELVVVRMRGDTEDRAERRIERVSASARGTHGAWYTLSTGRLP